MWLGAVVGLPQYQHMFTSGCVDGSLLLTLTDEDLSDLLGVRHSLHRCGTLYDICIAIEVMHLYLTLRNGKRYTYWYTVVFPCWCMIYYRACAVPTHRYW